ncbi:nitroreductase family protein [Sneathiella glossodoripedis]|uniref:nitroreductase family protein n=1 Tax=Sneathiella glossodoripedis TaxID=418853 RepID=UPI00046F5003|nr:nitroreductase [Sneathiella glossodoripedis]
MDALDALLNRKSVPRLMEPGPDEQQLEILFKAALRAPDHAALRPWQFIVFEGESRAELGDIFADALAAREPGTSEAALEKAKGKALRAPVVIAVIAKVSEHPKVPAIEQKLSAGAAAQNILIAAHAMGLAGIWRTGAACFDPYVRKKLGAVNEDEIVAFLYIGTSNGTPPLPELEISDYVSRWEHFSGPEN